MVKDVCYHLNDLAENRFGSREVCTLMTSIEASTIADRGSHGLLLQDAFIRDHITSNDYLIVSVGGNDIALCPTLRTAVNMAMLMLSPTWLVRAGFAPGLGYMVKIFHGRIESLLSRLVAKEKPRKVLVCMIYYPDPTPTRSWAGPTLGMLGYDGTRRRCSWSFARCTRASPTEASACRARRCSRSRSSNCCPRAATTCSAWSPLSRAAAKWLLLFWMCFFRRLSSNSRYVLQPSCAHCCSLQPYTPAPPLRLLFSVR